MLTVLNRSMREVLRDSKYYCVSMDRDKVYSDIVVCQSTELLGLTDSFTDWTLGTKSNTREKITGPPKRRAMADGRRVSQTCSNHNTKREIYRRFTNRKTLASMGTAASAPVVPEVSYYWLINSSSKVGSPGTLFLLANESFD
jgi:hypothetical protein